MDQNNEEWAVAAFDPSGRCTFVSPVLTRADAEKLFDRLGDPDAQIVTAAESRQLKHKMLGYK